MFKSNDKRLDETVTFIGNIGTIDAGYRTRAVNFLNTYIQQHAGEAKTVSQSMHIGDSSADPNNTRHLRRAYVLLHNALNTVSGTMLPARTLPLPTIGISPAVSQQNLPDFVKLAAILDDQRNNNTYSMTKLLNELRNDPIAFLTANPVMVKGTGDWHQNQGDTNTITFYLKFEQTAGVKRFEFSKYNSPGAATIQVDSVVARWWTDIPGSHVAGPNIAAGNFSQMTGIRLVSPMMITTQFTGCAFSMKRANGGVYCSHTTPKKNDIHVYPTRLLSGTALAQEINTVNGVAGDFANAQGGNLAVYGSGWSHGTKHGVFYPAGLGGGLSYMTILGFDRGGGDYKIYSQVTQNGAIQMPHRIF